LAAVVPEQGHPEIAKDPSADQPADDEVSLLDLLIVLAKHKRIVLGVPLLRRL